MFMIRKTMIPLLALLALLPAKAQAIELGYSFSSENYTFGPRYYGTTNNSKTASGYQGTAGLHTFSIFDSTGELPAAVSGTVIAPKDSDAKDAAQSTTVAQEIRARQAAEVSPTRLSFIIGTSSEIDGYQIGQVPAPLSGYRLNVLGGYYDRNLANGVWFGDSAGLQYAFNLSVLVMHYSFDTTLAGLAPGFNETEKWRFGLPLTLHLGHDVFTPKIRIGAHFGFDLAYAIGTIAQASGLGFTYGAEAAYLPLPWLTMSVGWNGARFAGSLKSLNEDGSARVDLANTFSDWEFAARINLGALL